ncbi:hypothetical protein MHBO_003698, partial [Bonamia ostreae]
MVIFAVKRGGLFAKSTKMNKFFGLTASLIFSWKLWDNRIDFIGEEMAKDFFFLPNSQLSRDFRKQARLNYPRNLWISEFDQIHGKSYDSNDNNFADYGDDQISRKNFFVVLAESVDSYDKKAKIVNKVSDNKLKNLINNDFDDLGENMLKIDEIDENLKIDKNLKISRACEKELIKLKECRYKNVPGKCGHFKKALELCQIRYRFQISGYTAIGDRGLMREGEFRDVDFKLG